MVISYYGHSCFKFRGDKATILIDPYKDIGLNPPAFEDIDILAITHSHPDHNNREAVIGGPKIVDAPGEYDIKDTFISGISTYHDKEKGVERGLNTVYKLVMDGINLCHLGDLGDKLSVAEVDSIGEVNVLFVPVGGKYTLNADEAVEVINQIEPNVVIPMHYKIKGSNVDIDPLDNFIEVYAGKAETVPIKNFKTVASDYNGVEEVQTKLVVLSKS